MENMDIGDIFIETFGVYPSLKEVDRTDFTLKDHVALMKAWLQEQLQSEEDAGTISTRLTEMGCLGPTVKMFDVKGECAHTVNMSKDWLTIQSQTAFSSIKANCCVFKGKWMYEVQLRSKGIMQIGWCSSKCKFTQDTGVGDTRNSYGLDGSKQRLWHVQTKKYGPYWRSGDVFGVCLDMDTGTIEYHRNGKALGEAFTDIERGAGIALFPAVSMAFNDSITANFGGSPFRHPVDGYEPLQPRPTNLIRNADFLLQKTIGLARQISQNKPKDLISPKPGVPSASGVQMVIGGILIAELSKVLGNTYVIEDRAFSYIKSMCVMRIDSKTQKLVYPGCNESTLGTFLRLMWAYMDPKDTKIFISRFVMHLSSMYRETPANLEYEKQRTVIVILTCLCNHPRTRKYLLEMRFFKKNCLPVFLYIKPPDESTLGELLPDEHIWTEGIGGNKDKYTEGCESLKRATDVLYVLQKHLVEVLLNNQDDESASTPSSLKIFASKMRAYVLENCLEHRQSNEFLSSHRGTPTQPAVALSFICIVLDVIYEKYDQRSATSSFNVRPSNFYDGSLHYSFFERLGGVVSHLSKAFNQELVDRIGADAVNVLLAGSDARPAASDMSIYSAMLVITGGNGSNATLADGNQTHPNSSLGIYVEPRVHSGDNFNGNRQMTNGPADKLMAYEDMLDACIMYYYGVAHKYVVMIAELRDNIGTLSDILIETKASFDDVKKILASEESVTTNAEQDHILRELDDKFGTRKNVFLQRSIELARKQVWYRAVALGERRRNLLSWMLNGIFDSLENASNDGVLFAFVPETYVNILPILLDTCLDFSHHDLAREFCHTDILPILSKGADFVASHTADSRIVVASAKDALLQALGTMACHEMGVRMLEQISRTSQLTLLRGLLRPYENRAWGQSNWLLNRFWLGMGFTYRDSRPPSVWQTGNQTAPTGLLRSRGKIGAHTGLLHHIAPACPSVHYHEQIAQVLYQDEPFSTIFVNSILSQLNWAFSEFILFLQEIQNNVQRQDQHLLTESRQLKICSMCFELTVSLLRSLEMLLNIAPDIFKAPDRANSDLLLNRVCQLICQVLARVTVPPGVFQFVVDLCLPDLSGITHFSIVTATIGIILALLSEEMNDFDWDSSETVFKVPRITRILLSDPSFQVAHLKFTLSNDTAGTVHAAPIHKGNFDPQSRVNIDPLTNEVKVVSQRMIKPEQPIMKFNLSDYTSHVTSDEIETINRIIDFIQRHETIISDTALPSEENMCPICYAKSVSAIFEPCKHQSCANCIAQHLMNNKVCFYCKAQITKVHNFDGVAIYEALDTVPPVPISDDETD